MVSDLQTVEEMLNLFTKIRKVYADEFGRRFEDEGYSPNEISVLMFLSNNPSMNTNSRLCACLGVSKGLVCRSIDSLIGKGLVVSAPDERDKRVQRLSLTAEASPLIEKIRGIREQIEREVLEGIPAEHISVMEETMQKIIGRFEEKAGETL